MPNRSGHTKDTSGHNGSKTSAAPVVGVSRSPLPQPGGKYNDSKQRTQRMKYKSHLKVLCWCMSTEVSVPQEDVMARLTLPCSIERCKAMDAEARA